MRADKRALVLMTALLPTVGHKNLILYARMLAEEVDVLVCTRSFEPVSKFDRYHAFKAEFNNVPNINIITYEDDNVPQNPEDHSDFWNVWKDIVTKNTKIKDGDIVVASEQYGYELAEVLGCKYYPYDLNRDICNVKSTNVRSDIVDNFDQILPSFKSYLQTRITLFGAECCGKTTSSRHVSNWIDAYWLPEWARSYLESLGNPIVTPELMDDITEGQAALQFHSQYALTDKPFIIQDTDLLSTIGYYKIMGLRVPDKIVNYFKQCKSDMYFLMMSNIPFVSDPLHYGGDKRESTDEFWIDLLEEYGCNYYIVDQDNKINRVRYIRNTIYDYADVKFSEIGSFNRD